MSEWQEKLLRNRPFLASHNDYDWLGEGIYFWESNPLRGLEFAAESLRRKSKELRSPTVIGAVIDLGFCLDLTTSQGLSAAATAYQRLRQVFEHAGEPMPENHPDGLRNHLDCAVLNYLHYMRKEEGRPAFDSVKGIFIERPSLYPGSAFGIKNHVQIAVRNQDCIKGVFRVPPSHLDPTA